MTTHRDEMERIPCPICGNTNYEWGSLGGDDGSSVKYYPLEESSFEMLIPRYPMARKCRECSNLQQFDLFDKHVTDNEKAAFQDDAVDITKQWFPEIKELDQEKRNDH